MQSLEYIPLLSASRIVFAVFWMSILACAAYTIYNLCFHPLASFPGPWYAACSPVWYTISLFSGTLAFDVQKLHERYGDVVRISPKELSYRDPKAWRDIYGQRPELPEHEMGKDPDFYAGFATGSTAITTASHRDHTRIRRVIAPAFSSKALQEQAALIEPLINLLIDRLREHGNTPLDMSAWYNYATFDILGTLLFGESFHCLEKAEYKPWVSMIFLVLKTAMLVQACLRAPGLTRLLLWYFVPRELMSKRICHIALTEAKIDNRMAMGSGHKDIFSRFMHSDQMSRREILTNSSNLIVAGSETTASALAGVTYLLLKHPEKMAKAVSEVRSTFSIEKEITMLRINGLEYIAACCEETLRMYPTVPIGLPREVPSPGATVCGQFVPAKTAVAMTHLATYRSATNFKDPDSFVPERWMNDAQYAGDRKSALQPFHIGPRGCVGKSLAYTELKWILTRVLWNFDLKLMKEGEDWMDQSHFMTWQRGPLMIQLSSRSIQ